MQCITVTDLINLLEDMPEDLSVHLDTGENVIPLCNLSAFISEADGLVVLTPEDPD